MRIPDRFIEDCAEKYLTFNTGQPFMYYLEYTWCQYQKVINARIYPKYL